MEQAEKVAQRLAREGVIGRFAVDFVVVQGDDGQWQPYAIEINLRKGGTTAPHLTLEYLTDGHYDAQAGDFRTVRGDEKCYVASDHVESEAYRVFTPDSLMDIVSRHRLHYDHARQTGVVMHMLCNVGVSGTLGATVIADTHEAADALYDALRRGARPGGGYLPGRVGACAGAWSIRAVCSPRSGMTQPGRSRK